MGNNKGTEWARLRHGPRLVSMLAIVPVEESGANEVDSCNGQGDLV